MQEFVRSVEVLLADGLCAKVDVTVRISDAGDPRYHEVSVDVLGCRYIGLSPRGLFFALQDLRRKLEPMNVWLNCLGAKKDVYPTPMMESMGSSLEAVRREIGLQTKEKDVVDIFDIDSSKAVATVDEQEAYAREWSESLRR